MKKKKPAVAKMKKKGGRSASNKARNSKVKKIKAWLKNHKSKKKKK